MEKSIKPKKVKVPPRTLQNVLEDILVVMKENSRLFQSSADKSRILQEKTYDLHAEATSRALSIAREEGRDHARRWVKHLPLFARIFKKF